MWVATIIILNVVKFFHYFNSHHPCGWRLTLQYISFVAFVFQLTPPMWVATFNTTIHFICCVCISTHTTHVGGDGNPTNGNANNGISTHTTHVGGDFQQPHSKLKDIHISTHTTHVGGDFGHFSCVKFHVIFQLTPPMWVATGAVRNSHTLKAVFQLTPPMWVATCKQRRKHRRC